MNAPEAGELTLLPVSACLQQARHEIMLLRTLVGLSREDTEQVLMPTVERLAAWVLNLDDPMDPRRRPLFQSALGQALETLQWLGNPADPAGNLALGLGTLIQAVSGVLQPLTVQACSDAAIEPWGMYSGSLKGWADAHQCHRVHWSLQSSSSVVWTEAAPLFAGRVVGGACFAWLEGRRGKGIWRLWTAASHPRSWHVVRAAKSLVQRGVWRCDVPPGRLWKGQAGYWLLWPLAGQDLSREIKPGTRALASPEPGQWLAWLEAAGAVEGEVVPVPHPLLGRSVQAVGTSGLLTLALHRLLP